MSKNGYYGDFGSFAEEQEAYRQYMERQEPNVVPCFKCGNQMYEESEIPEENICIDHKTLLNTTNNL